MLPSERKRRNEKGSLGFWVSPEMLHLAETPGYLSGNNASRLRTMYSREYNNWKPLFGSVLSEFCFTGHFTGVQELVKTNSEIPLGGSDSDLRIGYASQVIIGAQHLRSTSGAPMQHKELLEYLCNLGCPVDHTDIVGYTAFFHSTKNALQLELAKILLIKGSNVNHRNKFGSTPLIEAVNDGNFDAVQFLLEFGADLDLCDANGESAEGSYRSCGGKMGAIIENWKRKKAGVEGPLQEKKCAACKQGGQKLQFCSRCRLVEYCSKECQRAHWKDHKAECFASLAQKVVVVKPHYHNASTSIPITTAKDISRGNPIGTSSKNKTPATSGTNMILKIQAPFMGSSSSGAPLLVYDRHRTFNCTLNAEENPVQYREIAEVIRKKGTSGVPGGPGVKAYFLANLSNQDKLEIKLENVLAPQPF